MSLRSVSAARYVSPVCTTGGRPGVICSGWRVSNTASPEPASSASAGVQPSATAMTRQCASESFVATGIVASPFASSATSGNQASEVSKTLRSFAAVSGMRIDEPVTSTRCTDVSVAVARANAEPVTSRSRSAGVSGRYCMPAMETPAGRWRSSACSSSCRLLGSSVNSASSTTASATRVAAGTALPSARVTCTRTRAASPGRTCATSTFTSTSSRSFEVSTGTSVRPERSTGAGRPAARPWPRS